MTFLIAYYDRLNISLAMPLIAAENAWTDTETAANGSLLMGLFYAGYGVANIFLTPLGARIGPRKSLVVIILLWSLFILLVWCFYRLIYGFFLKKLKRNYAELRKRE